jgi:PAS domain S-box-containing protein
MRRRRRSRARALAPSDVARRGGTRFHAPGALPPLSAPPTAERLPAIPVGELTAHDGGIRPEHAIVRKPRDRARPVDPASLERTADATGGATAGEAAGIELRRQEQRLRLIIDGVRDHAISMLDREGRIETFNGPAERIKGYSLTEVRGQHFRMFFTAEDRARRLPEHELEVARVQGRYEGEGWRQRKDGSRFYAAGVAFGAARPFGRNRG